MSIVHATFHLSPLRENGMSNLLHFHLVEEHMFKSRTGCVLLL